VTKITLLHQIGISHYSIGHEFSIENTSRSQHEKKDLQYTLDVTCYEFRRKSGRHVALKLNSAEADPSI